MKKFLFGFISRYGGMFFSLANSRGARGCLADTSFEDSEKPGNGAMRARGCKRDDYPR